MMAGDNEAAREQYRRDGWWRDGTFLDDLRRHAAADPGKPAVIARLTPDAETETISYAELAAATDRFSHALLALDVKPGEVAPVAMGAREHPHPMSRRKQSARDRCADKARCAGNEGKTWSQGHRLDSTNQRAPVLWPALRNTYGS